MDLSACGLAQCGYVYMNTLPTMFPSVTVTTFCQILEQESTCGRWHVFQIQYLNQYFCGQYRDIYINKL